VQAIVLCERYGKHYYIKDDLAKHLEGVTFTNTDTRTVTRQFPKNYPGPLSGRKEGRTR
jgi:hypothetical protein